MNRKQIRTIALQAAGEYMMNHIAGVMEMLQDTRAQYHDAPDEAALVIIEAQVKAIAEGLTQQAKEHAEGVRTNKRKYAWSYQQ